MRIVAQRVNTASVSVGGELLGEITFGLVLLVGFGKESDSGPDTQTKLANAADRVAHLRIFPDDAGRFHRSVLDIGGGVLAVPQFTLYGDMTRGRRPDFFGALEPEKALELFEGFVAELRKKGIARVETGRFGAHMKVQLENDGPVTILLEF